MLAATRTSRALTLKGKSAAVAVGARSDRAAMSSSAPKRSTEPSAPPGYSVDKSVGPTYRFERSLPNLPVPTIESTATKYLDSIRPFVSKQGPHTPTASDADPTEAYLATKKAVDEFRTSPLVKELQERLVKRAEQEGRDSWLSEWWNEAAYMGYRDPVVPYVSYYYLHRDDRATKTGPKRAAALVRSLLYFRRMTETYAPSIMREASTGADPELSAAKSWSRRWSRSFPWPCRPIATCSTPAVTPLNRRTPRRNLTPTPIITSPSSVRAISS